MRSSSWRRIKPWCAKIFRCLSGLAFAGFFAANRHCYAGGPTKNSTQIEYISPDGQFSSLTAAQLAPHKATAAFVDKDTVSCVLREGETTFIIELPNNGGRDRFTLLNENAAACGELRIAVSDSPLPADSPKWTAVDGIIPFAHKRLFKLSMLGVETKFVRLSFKVDGHRQDSAQIPDPFRISVLMATINSNFSKFDQAGHDLSFAAVLVAPLPANRK
jgi:hypothetical protein